MEDQLIRTADQSEAPFPTIRTVPMLAALDWLRKGLDDAKAAPKASLFYGLCFAAMGFLISFVFRNAYHLTSGLTAGFLLVGPYFAIGLYELSRRRERGEPLDLGPTLTVWRKHMANVGVFSLILTVIFLVWARASMVVFALFYTQEMPTLDSFLRQLIGLENLEFMFAYFAVGLLFASIVFAISVVSIPMMMDRGQDSVTAMIASTIALFRNVGPLTLWAAVIVTLTVIGIVTFFIGLIFLMPIVGHATWHAYRDLVEQRP